MKLMANISSFCLSSMLMLIVQRVSFYTNTAGRFDETQPGLLFDEVDSNPKAELTNVDVSLAGTLEVKTSGREGPETIFLWVSQSSPVDNVIATLTCM